MNKREVIKIYKEILAGKRKGFPSSFWKSDEGLKNAERVTKWLIEEKLKWSCDDIRKRLTQRVLIDHGLAGMSNVFNRSPYRVINNAYPRKFKRWEFRKQINIWQGEEGRNLAIQATKWLIEEKLRWNDDDIRKKLTAKTFAEYGLRGMLKRAFGDSPYKAINRTYPGRFKPWEFKQMGIWRGRKGLKMARNTTICLIEKKLNWTDKDIKGKLSCDVFLRHGLSGMLWNRFGGSPYKAIENAYPGRFNPWDFKNQRNIWKEEEGLKLAKKATRWLIERKLRWKHKEVKEKLQQQVFFRNGLGAMLQVLFDGSPYRAIENAYPGRFKPWELRGQRRIWRGKEGLQTARQATRWMIEEKLGWKKQDVKRKLTKETFEKCGLGGMFATRFSNSIYEAINNAYPREFHPWQFSNLRIWQGKKGLEMAKRAIKWLIEEELKWNATDIKHRLSEKTFIEHGLSGMLQTLFGSSPYRAIKHAYPGKFKRGDFRYFRLEAKLGDFFEKELKAIYETMGLRENEDFLYQKYYRHCRHKKRCRPDFQFVKRNYWVDAKLCNYTVFRTQTLRYTKHCRKLIILYLVGDENLEIDNLRAEMKSVKTFYPRLRRTKQGRQIIKSLNKIEKEAKKLY